MQKDITNIQGRQYRGEEDLSLIAAFLERCESVYQVEEIYSAHELQEEFTSPGVDQARDLRLWEDADGQMCGFGQLWIPLEGEVADGFLWYKVAPEQQDGALDAEIIAWGEQRLREVGQERGQKAVLRVGAPDTYQHRLQLLPQHGYEIVRYFWRMTRPLNEPLPEATFPEGYIVRPINGRDEAVAWVECFNQSFIDHWNHHPLKVEERLHWMDEENYRPDLDLVAVAPDGTIAAFANCGFSPDEHARTGRKDGWVYQLGTRRGYRKLGLGRAMLVTGMERLRDAGMENAVLGVDAANPSGATKLYESVGFRRFRTFVSFNKELV